MKIPGASKSVMPALPSFTIDRPRLFALIDANAHGAIWLHGPPGAGKTTLARSYARHAGAVPLFVNTMREAVTLPGLINALSASYAQTSLAQTALPVMEANSSEHAVAFAQHYFEALADAVGGQAVIILDDLHRASSPEVFAAVAAGITQCAGRLMVIITSQHLPDAMFAEPIARGQLTIIGRPQLALDEQEATALACKLSTDAQTAARLLASTGGWAAGVMLGLQYAGASSTPTDAAHEPTIALLARYMSASCTSETIQALNVLQRLPAIPDTVLDQHPHGSDVRRALQGLAGRALFVELDRNSRPRTWRMHELCKAALQYAHGQCVDSNVDQGWALALASAEQTSLAVKLLHELGQTAQAAQWLEKHAPVLFEQRQVQELLELAHALVPYAQEHADLSYWVARSALNQDASEAAQWGEHCYQAALPAHRYRLCHDVSALMLLAKADEFGDRTGWDTWAKRLHTAIKENPSIAEQSPFWNLVGTVAADQLSRTETPGALARLVELVQTQHCPSPDEWLAAARLCLSGFIDQSNWQAVQVLINAVQGHVSYLSCSGYQRIIWLYNTGYANFLALNRDEALHIWTEALSLAEQAGHSSLSALCKVGLTRIHVDRDELDQAAAVLHEAMLKIELYSPIVQIYLYHLCARVALRQQRYSDALRLLSVAQQVMDWSGIDPKRFVVLYVELVQTYIALNDYERAFETAATLTGYVRATSDPYSLAFNAIVSVFASQGTPSAAFREHLNRAIDPLMRINFKGFLRSVPLHAAQLCAWAIEQDICKEFVIDAIKTRKLSAPKDATFAWPWPVKIKLLGEFSVYVDGSALALSGKVAQKPLDLIKLLAISPNFSLSQEAVCSALWEDDSATDAGSAKKNLEATISRARKLIGDTALKVGSGRVALCTDLVGCDVAVLTAACNKALALGHHDVDQLAAMSQRLLKIYSGHLLPGQDGAWIEGARQNLRDQFVRAACAIAAAWQDLHRENDTAIELMEQATACEPLAEKLYVKLMQLYVADGNSAHAMQTYRRCKQQLSLVLGIAPSRHTEELKKQLLYSEPS